MRVLLIADSDFARRERAMLSRLELGLIGEGVRVVLALPEGIEPVDQRVYSTLVRFPPAGPAWTRRRRARNLLESIGRRLAAGAPGAGGGGAPGGGEALVFDAVHAFGAGVWMLASDLGAWASRDEDGGKGRVERRRRMGGVPLALEIFDHTLATRAAELGDAPTILLTPDREIERAIHRVRGRHGAGRRGPADAGAEGGGSEARQSHAPVRLIRWGVPISSAATEGRGEASILMTGSGVEPEACRAAFEGIVAALDRAPKTGAPAIFVDETLSRRAGLWSLARRLGVLDRVTVVPDAETDRTLVLRSSILACPDSRGRCRSIVPEAMGAGMAVVARADALVAQDPRFMRLVTDATPAGWAGAIGPLVRDEGARRALGSSARDFARAEHRTPAQIAGVLNAYEWMTSCDAIAFPSP